MGRRETPDSSAVTMRGDVRADASWGESPVVAGVEAWIGRDGMELELEAVAGVEKSGVLCIIGLGKGGGGDANRRLRLGGLSV